MMLLPVALILSPLPERQHRFLSRAMHGYLAFLTRVLLPGLGVYRLADIRGIDSSVSPAIYVANHRGRLDGPLLLGMMKDTGVIIKSKYTKQPVYAVFVRLLDFISINPGSLESLSRALARCKVLLRKKRSLLVFPEGTRSASGRLLPFRDLAFRIAIEHNVAVIPIVIYNDYPFMTKTAGSYFPMHRFNYSVHQLAPVYPLPHERPRELTERVRSLMASALQRLEKKQHV